MTHSPERRATIQPVEHDPRCRRSADSSRRCRFDDECPRCRGLVALVGSYIVPTTEENAR